LKREVGYGDLTKKNIFKVLFYSEMKICRVETKTEILSNFEEWKEMGRPLGVSSNLKQLVGI
jgi:hypothetical protein